MGDILFAFNIVAPIFIMVAAGYFFTQIKLWNAEFLKVGNKVCFTVFLPVLLFYNIYKSNFSDIFNAKLIVFIIAAVTVLFLLAVLFIPLMIKDRARCGVVIQALFRSNYLLLGVPICQSMFGDIGGATASVVAAFVIPYFNILATIVLSIFNKERITSVRVVIKKILLNPLIIGSVLGIVAVAIGLKLPGPIDTTLRDVKEIATPLALLLLGGDFKFHELFSNLGAVIWSTIGRLIIVPAIMLPIAIWLGFSGVSIGVLVSIFCTPVAVSSYVMTRQMKGDYVLAGQLVVSTTFCSMFTIFGFIYILRILGLA